MLFLLSFCCFFSSGERHRLNEVFSYHWYLQTFSLSPCQGQQTARASFSFFSSVCLPFFFFAFFFAGFCPTGPFRVGCFVSSLQFQKKGCVRISVSAKQNQTSFSSLALTFSSLCLRALSQASQKSSSSYSSAAPSHSPPPPQKPE
jgi:hypothetical protein